MKALRQMRSAFFWREVNQETKKAAAASFADGVCGSQDVPLFQLRETRISFCAAVAV
jgi:hypothetical protein